MRDERLSRFNGLAFDSANRTGKPPFFLFIPHPFVYPLVNLMLEFKAVILL
jgi:hypothetical protein